MKTELSRIAQIKNKRYSGVYQQQGRMLTDADWNQLNEIIKAQLHNSMADTLGDGSPRNKGMIKITESGGSDIYALQWGHAYVDGIHAEITPDQTVDLSDPLTPAFEFDKQGDFPYPPPLPNTGVCLYLDVWERTVTALEDSDLMDPGLHGADTCTRTQTMAQVKWCDPTINPEDPAQNPIQGDAPLSLVVRQGQAEPDPCNPCDAELVLDTPLGNYLFRIEVHDAVYQSGQLEEITLKWSSENGALAFVVEEEPAGFKSSKWAYEFFNGSDQKLATEKHLGLHLNTDTWLPKRGALYSAYPETLPAGYSQVRRWDGFGKFTKQSDGSWALATNSSGQAVGSDRGIPLSTESSLGDPAHVEEGATLALNLNTMDITFALGSHFALAGDYWAVPVREAIHVAGSVLLSDALPVGIRHHYMTLIPDTLGTLEWTSPPWSPEKLRQLRFPPLTDINADDVGFTMPSCQDSVPDDTLTSLLANRLGSDWPTVADENASVQQILDALLCHLDASSVPLKKTEPLCLPLQENSVVSVQDALNVICAERNAGCCTITLQPEQAWESVLESIPDNSDATICFMAGVYELNARVALKDKGHLRLVGSGPGTQINARSLECAILFENCSSVQVSNLAARSFSVGQGRGTEKEHLNGVFTFVDCAQVMVQQTQLRCAAGTHLAGTCVTIRNAPATSGVVDVRNNQLTVGHYQQAILLVNTQRADVQDNRIKVAPKPASLTFEKLLEDASRLNQFAASLAHDVVAIDKEIDVAISQGDTSVSAGEYAVAFDSDLSSEEWQTAFDSYVLAQGITVGSQKILEQSIGELRNNLVEAPDDLAGLESFPVFQSKLSEVQRDVGAAQYQAFIGSNTGTDLIGDFLISSPVRATAKDIVRRTNTHLSSSRYNVHLNSAVRESEWQRLLSDNPPAANTTEAGMATHINRLAKRLLTDAVFLEAYTFFKVWVDELKLYNPAVMARGIVCAGQIAKEVRIQDNSIQNTLEGVRVGVSHHTPDDDSFDQAGYIDIRNNVLGVRTPLGVNKGRQAVFVGNARQVAIENNRISAPGLSATTQKFQEGIHIFGHLGRMVVVRQNFIANCSDAVTVKPLGQLQNTNQWLVADNMMPYATNILVAPRQVKNRDNFS